MREASKRQASSAGAIALVVSVLFCSAAHLLLRSGAVELSATSILSNWRLIAGLATYGCGTLLWIYCLGKLDLSIAFPASAAQFIFVLAGAHWILGEQISALQLIGTAIILLGIALLFFARRERDV